MLPTYVVECVYESILVKVDTAAVPYEDCA